MFTKRFRNRYKWFIFPAELIGTAFWDHVSFLSVNMGITSRIIGRWEFLQNAYYTDAVSKFVFSGKCEGFRGTGGSTLFLIFDISCTNSHFLKSASEPYYAYWGSLGILGVYLYEYVPIP